MPKARTREDPEASGFAPTHVRAPPRGRLTQSDDDARTLSAGPQSDDEEVTVIEPPAPTRPRRVLIARPTLHKPVPAHALPAAPGPTTMLQDVFLRTVQLERLRSVEEAMTFVLDLAVEKIPCEAGAALWANGASLVFIAARGPRAAQVLSSKVRLPLGKGLAGRCLATGNSVLVNSVQEEPRYTPRVDGQLARHTRSLLCSPMMAGGRGFGCLQLVNRADHQPFEPRELGLLDYLASQGAQFLNRFST